MKLRNGMIVSKVDDQYILVDAGEEKKRFSGLIRMNKTAAYIAECLQKECDESELVHALTSKYEVDEQRARQNIKKVIDIFQENGLLE